MIVVTFEFETVGSNMFSNTCFAIGYCVGRVDNKAPASVISTGRWIVDLKKPSDVTWEKYWKEKGWEQYCYKDFWSKNLQTLDYLQQCLDLLDDEYVLFNKLNTFLEELERDYGDFSIVLDIVAFDSVWISTKLQEVGCPALTKNRDGTGYRPVFELDSYRFGVFGVELGEWDTLASVMSDLMSIYTIERTENLRHDPQVDAYNIFADFANAHDYVHLSDEKRRVNGN